MKSPSMISESLLSAKASSVNEGQSLKTPYVNCKTEITARVTVENGETVIYKEEAINQLLEKEFTDAINALAEE